MLFDTGKGKWMKLFKSGWFKDGSCNNVVT